MIKGLKLTYRVIEEWNEEEQTGKWELNFDNNKLGELIATGNLMMESQIIITDIDMLLKTIFDLKNITNENGVFKELNEFSFIEKEGKLGLYCDMTDKIIEIENERIVFIEEDYLAHLFSQISSLIKEL